MKLDLRSEAAVQGTCDGITKDLYEANTLEVFAIPLWYQNYCLPGAIVGERTITKRYLHYGNHLKPLGGVRLLLTCCLLNTLTGVLHSHVRRPP